MGEPIAGVGYLAGICAHDGTDWQKLKIDSEGRLEVSVVAGHEYVDRGDPAAADFTEADLTMDANWYDLDLSGIITDSDAVLVHLGVTLSDLTLGSRILFREKGNVNTFNACRLYTQGVDQVTYGEFWITLDANLYIQYYASEVLSVLYITVHGWMRPAA